MRAARGLPENLIRLCVGIEDPRDLMDDLEHSLLSSGAIGHNIAYSPISQSRSDELYAIDREAWILERAKGFKRPDSSNVVDRLVDGVARSLGLKDGERKRIDEDVVVGAPGKVILFGEHAVVHGVVSCYGPLVRFDLLTVQTAIATSVNLRCFAVLSPRADNAIALEAPDVDADMEFDIASLPWNLLPLRNQKPKTQVDKELDPELLRAIEVIVDNGQRNKREVGTAVAFLYLYMLIGGSDKNS